LDFSLSAQGELALLQMRGNGVCLCPNSDSSQTILLGMSVWNSRSATVHNHNSDLISPPLLLTGSTTGSSCDTRPDDLSQISYDCFHGLQLDIEVKGARRMGQCVSKPASQPDVSKTAVEQPKLPTTAVQEARQPAASPAETPSIDILPAPPSVAPSVAILPPWVSHNETDMTRRPSSSAAVSTVDASNPAANALRSNLSEVRPWLGTGFDRNTPCPRCRST
jgi:hypothetical protein